jgi:AcrR family transcriptional regulator
MPSQRSRSGTREQLAATALRLFAERGFEATTVDDIADAAGISRRTFFRHFPTKEDAIFPDHDGLRTAVGAQLDMRDHETPVTAMCNAVRVVLQHYVDEGDVALDRYALTSQIPALRERELVSVHGYQRLFVNYLRSRLREDDALTHELMAAGVVAGHNAALRSWLRSNGKADAMALFERAAGTIHELFQPPAGSVVADTRSGANSEPVILVLPGNTPWAKLAQALQEALASAGTANLDTANANSTRTRTRPLRPRG